MLYSGKPYFLSNTLLFLLTPNLATQFYHQHILTLYVILPFHYLNTKPLLLIPPSSASVDTQLLHDSFSPLSHPNINRSDFIDTSSSASPSVHTQPFSPILHLILLALLHLEDLLKHVLLPHGWTTFLLVRNPNHRPKLNIPPLPLPLPVLSLPLNTLSINSVTLHTYHIPMWPLLLMCYKVLSLVAILKHNNIQHGCWPCNKNLLPLKKMRHGFSPHYILERKQSPQSGYIKQSIRLMAPLRGTRQDLS